MRLFLLLISLLIDLYSANISHLVKLRQESALLTNNAKFQKASIYAKLNLQAEFEDSGRLVLISTLEADAKDKIEPHRYNSDKYNDFLKVLPLGTHGNLELREFFYEKEIEGSIIKLGKMQTVWGKADGIKLIDRLNPQNFSEFILPSFEESRIALWTFSFLKSLDNSEFEFIAIIDNTRNKIPVNGASFEFTSRRIIPQIPKNVSINKNDVANPNDFILDSDVAFRYSKMLDNMEIGFYYFYLYNDNQTLSQKFDKTSNILTITSKYERSSSYAFSMDYSKGDFVYRIETMLTNSDELSYIFGLDWYGLNQSLLSLQIFQSYLLKDKNRFSRDKVDNTVTFLYKKDLMNDTLHAELLAIHNINDNDGLIRPKLRYELDEESVVYVGIDKFYGNKNGLYGEFRKQSRIVLGIERTF